MPEIVADIRRRVWHVLLLLCPLVAMAQQLPLRYYGQQDGLANLAVTAMASDQRGFLWVATQNGLFRYNGDSFQRYGQGEGLSEAYVTALLADRDNRLWVGTYDNLFLKVGERLQPVLRDDGRKVNVWTSQSLTASPDGANYVLSGQRVYRLAMDNGHPRLHAVFSEQQIQQHPQLAQIASVHADAGGELWLGCGPALCHRDARGLTVWDSTRGVPDDDWEAALRDRGGQLWVHGKHHILVMAAGAQRFADRTPDRVLMRNPGLRPQLAEDGQGRILANVDDGLVRWEQDHWRRYDTGNGLRSGGGVNALQFDHDGGLWLGSLGQGIVHWLGYDNWENWTTAQGLPEDGILSFARSGQGALYVGTRTGLATLRPSAQRFVPAASSLPGERWSSLTQDGQGRVWGGTASGLLVQFGADGSARVQGRGLQIVYGLLADRQQRLWVASSDGVATLALQTPAPRRPALSLFQPDGAAVTDYTVACQAPDDSIWLRSPGHLSHYDGSAWHIYSREKLLAGAELSAMACSADGSLWLTDAQNRLYRARLGQQGWQFQRIDKRLFADADIIGLREDSRGWLWVGTDAGIAVWNRDHWRFFNQNDGLVWNDSNGCIFFEDRDGSMWIATSNGASHVLHPERLFTPQPLGVQIEAARRDKLALAPQSSWTLPWSSAPLELNLSSLYYGNRGMLRYHYRLAGLETDWISSAVPQVRYAALPPGQYQFEYYASNDYAHSVSAVGRQAIEVEPPWWRSTPFYLLCALLGWGLLALLYRLRVRQLLLNQLRTDQLVRERTLELEQSREQLRHRALRDSLTGAWNRGAILEIIDQALLHAADQQLPLLLVLLDLDHFKRINDRYGHAAGDAVLREAVARLSAAIRQSDAVGRYGGEEFVVLLRGLDEASGHGRVEELRHAIRSKPIPIGPEQAITVTGSFGAIAFDPRCPLAAAELIARADQALYRCKEGGRDRIEYAPSAS